MDETSPIETTRSDATRSDATAILIWIGATGLAAAVLIAGLSWMADRLPLSAVPGGGEAAASLQPGGEVVDFSLPSLDGGMIGPASFPGEIVLLEYWATWCGPCRLQKQTLDSLREMPGMGDVRIIAVNQGEPLDVVQPYAEKKNFEYPVALDEQETLGRRFRIHGLPTIMLLDQNHRIAFQRVGLTDKATLAAEIAKLRSAA